MDAEGVETFKFETANRDFYILELTPTLLTVEMVASDFNWIRTIQAEQFDEFVRQLGATGESISTAIQQAIQTNRQDELAGVIRELGKVEYSRIDSQWKP